MKNQDAFTYIKQEMNRQFKEKIYLEREETAWDRYGWFRLWFRYEPKSYWILFEGEYHAFNVRILADKHRFLPLRKLTDYKNSLTERNLKEVIQILRSCLDQDLPFRQIRRGREMAERDEKKKERLETWKERN